MVGRNPKNAARKGVSMFRRWLLCAAAGAVWAVAPLAASADDIFYSPLGGVAVGPDGPSEDITVAPGCCPQTAIVVRAEGVVEENDDQWVLLGLDLPESDEIRRLGVCYAIDTADPGETYISQTRLTEMRRASSATVRLDNRTDRTDPGPDCYDVSTNFRPRGTVTLHLKVVFGDPSDEITIGAVRLRLD
jgi:hypothetical protein